MANKRTSVLLAGLAAGAYAYFKKPENRDKAVEAFNSTKGKVNDFVETQKKNFQNKMSDSTDSSADASSDSTTNFSESNNTSTTSLDELTSDSTAENTVTGDVDKDYHLDEKDMVSEGAMTTVQYYNDASQDRLDTKERNYFIDDKNMVSEGALTKVKYEDAEEQIQADKATEEDTYSIFPEHKQS